MIYYGPESLNAFQFPLKTPLITFNTFDPLRQWLGGGFCTFETAELFVQLVGGWPTGRERGLVWAPVWSSLVSCCFFVDSV